MLSIYQIIPINYPDNNTNLLASFTDEEMGMERSDNFPKVTQEAKSKMWDLNPDLNLPYT